MLKIIFIIAAITIWLYPGKVLSDEPKNQTIVQKHQEAPREASVSGTPRGSGGGSDDWSGFREYKVSYYGNDVCRGKAICRTANGELFNEEKLTAACWNEFPFGTRFRVTYNNRFIVVICNDRGNFKKLGRFLDLSKGSFKSIAPLSKGVITVKVEKL